MAEPAPASVNMTNKALKPLVLASLACAALVAAGPVRAGPVSAEVRVKVKFVSSSGACGARTTPPAVTVGCHPPHRPTPAKPPQAPVADAPQIPDARGPLLPDAGAVPYERVGTIHAMGVAPQPLPLYSDGTKITSWRVVTLDNARYVELTIAW